MTRTEGARALLLRRVRSAYVAILRREPLRRELVARRLRTVLGGGWKTLLRDMIDSDEFRVQILPGLVVTRTEFRAPQPVFFLHVPKTGGTSVRLALGEAIGVPAINLYGAWPTPDTVLHRYWPYWAGHAQVDLFPETHVGLTLFREPRSRILSMYRMHQFLRSGNRLPHGWNHPGPRRPLSRPLPFDRWLTSFREEQRLSIVGFFLPSATPAPDRRPSPEHVQRALQRPSAELLADLGRTLGRFRAAAWIHDNPAVARAICDVAGREPSRIPRVNVAEDNLPDPAPVHLDSALMSVIEEAARVDALVFSVAEEQGLIPALDRDRADDLFHAAAQRLNFVH